MSNEYFENSDGSKVWMKDKRLHREDGPARIYRNRDQEWWVHGLRHRDVGPAVIHPNGRQEWWVHGVRHRIDGPAVIHPESHQEWWFHGLILGFGVEGFYALWDRLNGEQREDLTLQKFFPGLPK